ncbi:YchJ family protein [Leucobacter aridicollis]|uniref:YchJ family protein n=1 Tax=Leucobacter aridicollis TaxID=283878 RepID=UPI0021078E6C|nr:YchJ family protein [Leucobacter aridicollis]
MTALNPSAPCPCGFGDPYLKCCGPIHGGSPAPTAAQLMRSRYSAFAIGDEAYLLRTWHPGTRPRELELDGTTRWLRLIVEEAELGGPFDDTGYVTFSAIGRTPEGRFEQRERSRFAREHGNWFYVDGIEPPN